MTRGRRNRHETAGRLPGLSLPGYKGAPSVCTVHRPADSWTADHMLTSSERVVIGQLRRQSGVITGAGHSAACTSKSKSRSHKRPHGSPVLSVEWDVKNFNLCLPGKQALKFITLGQSAGLEALAIPHVRARQVSHPGGVSNGPRHSLLPKRLQNQEETPTPVGRVLLMLRARVRMS